MSDLEGMSNTSSKVKPTGILFVGIKISFGRVNFKSLTFFQVTTQLQPQNPLALSLCFVQNIPNSYPLKKNGRILFPEAGLCRIRSLFRRPG